MPNLIASAAMPPAGGINEIAGISGVNSQDLSEIASVPLKEGSGFLTTAWKVCKVALAAIIGLGVLVETINFLSGLVSLSISKKKTEGDPTAGQKGINRVAEKIKNLFLSFLLMIGGGAAFLTWCHHCSWLNLGGALAPLSFIGYPVTFITSSFSIATQMREVKELSTVKNDPEVSQKKKLAIVKLVAKVLMVTFSILGGAGVLFGVPVLAGMGFMCLLVSMMLEGMAWASHKISELKKPPKFKLAMP